MKHYLLNVIEPVGPMPPPEFLANVMRNVAVFEKEIKAAGAWVFNGALHPPSTATVVRMNDGEALMTDGPFAEGKEHIGGFMVIKAPDLDAALGMGQEDGARDSPAHRGSAVPGRARRGSRRTRALIQRGGRFRERDRTRVPRGARPRRGCARPRLRGHRRRRRGGAGRVRQGGRAMAIHRAAPESRRMDHHDRTKPRDRSPPSRVVARGPARPGRSRSRGRRLDRGGRRA